MTIMKLHSNATQNLLVWISTINKVYDILYVDKKFYCFKGIIIELYIILFIDLEFL